LAEKPEAKQHVEDLDVGDRSSLTTIICWRKTLHCGVQSHVLEFDVM